MPSPSTHKPKPPKTLAPFGPDANWDADRDVGWELYYRPDDFSQSKNIAADHPDKIQQLQSCGGRRPSATACCR
jgi:hypothetical protein